MKHWRRVAKGLVFIPIFLLIFTVVTLIYYPKWPPDMQSAQMSGFYREDKNTIDVLFLGSCNMYTSVAPVLLYEKYGITGYDFTGPDQSMATTYYYLKEALKRQKPKVVVIEALFLTGPDSEKRAYYNRYALDYMPLSLNKIALSAVTSINECEVMHQYDEDYPNTVFTFFSYLFPLLRYHSRNDLTLKDLTFFRDTDLTNYTKGSWAQYSYTQNDGMIWDIVHNSKEIMPLAKEYFPKIKKLCDKEGIELVVIKSPNYARWGYDDTYTAIARSFVEEMDIPFLDFQSVEYNTFQEYDYGISSGRLNIYGMAKLTDSIGKYLTVNYRLKETSLNEQQKAHWDDCVKRFYQKATEKGMSLVPGDIVQTINKEDGINIRWNEFDDCNIYDMYRCEGGNGSYSLLKEGISGNTYLDTDVKHGQGYTYYVVPKEGEAAGKASAHAYYVFVEMPSEVKAKNENGVIHLNWNTKWENIYKFDLQKRFAYWFDFSNCPSVTKESHEKEYTFVDEDVKLREMCRYRISSVYEDDTGSYYSAPALVYAVPLLDPYINEITSVGSVNILHWNPLPKQGQIFIYRREAGHENEKYALIGTINATETEYEDHTAISGVQYFYRIRSERTIYKQSAKSNISNTVDIVTGQ